MLGQVLRRAAAGPARRVVVDRRSLGVAAAATAVLAAADLSTPPRVSFAAFYLLPVMLASWSCGSGVAVGLGVLANLAPLYQQLQAEPPDAPWLVAWNTLSRLLVAVVVAQLVARLSRSLRTARRLSEVDHLTGVANRRQFERAADAELRRCQRYGRGFTLVLLDLDGFKVLNDRHGHHTGDAALRALARALSRLVRPSDLVARLGGDEFVVLLPELGPELSQHVVADLERRLERALAEHEQPLRVSVGAASFAVPPRALPDALQAADRAMYAAKAARRDRARTASAGGPVPVGEASGQR